MMRHGKKAKARALLLFALKKQKKFIKALHNVKPSLDIREVRRGATTYAVPLLIGKIRQKKTGIRYILTTARLFQKTKSKEMFSHFLNKVLIESFRQKGQAIQKRDALHKLAEANRAFLRYRWW